MDTTSAEFDNHAHRDQVVRPWQLALGYDAPHNAPELAIDRKVAGVDGLFLVALHGDAVIGTVKAGYDGHRGWIYAMAVHPEHRRFGIDSHLLGAPSPSSTRGGRPAGAWCTQGRPQLWNERDNHDFE